MLSLLTVGLWQWFAHLTFPDYPRFKERRVKKLLKDWAEEALYRRRGYR